MGGTANKDIANCTMDLLQSREPCTPEATKATRACFFGGNHIPRKYPRIFILKFISKDTQRSTIYST